MTASSGDFIIQHCIAKTITAQINKPLEDLVIMTLSFTFVGLP